MELFVSYVASVTKYLTELFTRIILLVNTDMLMMKMYHNREILTFTMVRIKWSPKIPGCIRQVLPVPVRIMFSEMAAS